MATAAISISDITEMFFNPVTGRTDDAVHPHTGLGLYSRLSHDELSKRAGVALERLPIDEAVERQAKADRARYCKRAEPVTAERADEMLNVLPPYRWANLGDVEHFAVGEPLCGDLVSWFVRIGAQWFELVESRHIDGDQLIQLCR